MKIILAFAVALVLLAAAGCVAPASRGNDAEAAISGVTPSFGQVSSRQPYYPDTLAAPGPF